MTNKKNQIESEEAQDALDSIKEMEHAGLKRVLAVPRWLDAILALLIGTQIALLGAGVRTYNTLLIVLIAMMVIAIANKNRSAGVLERMVLSKRTIIISVICLIATYFLAIITGQYLKGTFGYDWAPFAIGVVVIISIWGLMTSSRRTYFAKFNKEEV